MDLSLSFNTFAVFALIPILFGTIIKLTSIFVEKPSEFRNRIELIEKSMLEKLAGDLAAALSHLKQIIGTDELLRGDGRESPDFIGDYTYQLNRTFKSISGLTVLKSRFETFHMILLITIVIGIFLFIFSLLFSDLTSVAKNIISIITVIIVVLQVLSLVFLVAQTNKVNNYEQLK